MKQYPILSLAVALSLIVVFLFAERPKPENEPAPAAVVKSAQQEAAQQSSPEESKDQRAEKPYSRLQARNIFDPDGSYAASAEQKSLGETALTLLGVIGGKTKSAIFRDAAGAVIAVAEGQSLDNGAVITRIDRTSVIAERGEEKREFLIFDMKAKSPPSGASFPLPPAVTPQKSAVTPGATGR